LLFGGIISNMLEWSVIGWLYSVGLIVMYGIDVQLNKVSVWKWYTYLFYPLVVTIGFISGVYKHLRDKTDKDGHSFWNLLMANVVVIFGAGMLFTHAPMWIDGVQYLYVWQAIIAMLPMAAIAFLVSSFER
jgi:hypothetical protein